MQLEITNLNKTYAGKIAALKDVSLTIGPACSACSVKTGPENLL